jgi:uncharacterized protein (TIGR02246 family)
MSSSAPPPPTIEDATRDHSDDIVAIEQLIADVEAGFNANDPDRSVAHFASDASAVDAAGRLARGRDELLEADRTRLAGPARDQHVRYELADVVFLRPDVAVAHKRARATNAAGEAIDVGHSMISLYVLVRQQGRWWIAARQDTIDTSASTTRAA